MRLVQTRIVTKRKAKQSDFSVQDGYEVRSSTRWLLTSKCRIYSAFRVRIYHCRRASFTIGTSCLADIRIRTKIPIPRRRLALRVARFLFINFSTGVKLIVICKTCSSKYYAVFIFREGLVTVTLYFLFLILIPISFFSVHCNGRRLFGVVPFDLSLSCEYNFFTVIHDTLFVGIPIGVLHNGRITRKKTTELLKNVIKSSRENIKGI